MLQSDKVKSGEQGKIRLRQAYKEAGLTIEKLADNAQVSPDTIKRLLGTKECPNGVERWAVTNIANALNIKPTDIVDLKDWNPQQQLPPEFEPLIKGKTKTFCGRKFVFAAFEKFINTKPNGYFTVVGDAGMGKSALAAKYVFDKQVSCYFNILAEGRNRPELFLKSIRQQLISRYQLQDATDDDLATLLTKVSKKLPAGDRLVIVVDALDEVEQEPGAENLLYLPRELPEQVYFLLTRSASEN
ncbi:MAG TPA: AAA family ATPase [Coleofasciculaceae cyanobacterium]|jgi:lambda repressor-like predicted transcriptional regulator